MAQKQEQLTIKVMLPPCRMSFPWLFKPQDTDGGPRYQLNALFPPGSDLVKFEDALYDAMEDMFGKDIKKWPKGRTDRGPDQVIRDATEKDYEGYKPGWKFIKAASKDPVGIVDARREAVTNEREVYGGRWCRLSVTVRAYDNKSKGVGVYLNSIQLLDHDEQFGGRGPAKNDFEDWDGDPLSKDDRGTGSGTAVSRSDDDDDDADDRSTRRARDTDDRQGRDRDVPRGRGDTRDSARDDRGTRDDRSTRRAAEPDRGDDDDDRPRDRGRDTRDDDRRGRGARDEPADEPKSDRRPSRRDDPEDERPSRRSRDSKKEDWN